MVWTHGITLAPCTQQKIVLGLYTQHKSIDLMKMLCGIWLRYIWLKHHWESGRCTEKRKGRKRRIAKMAYNLFHLIFDTRRIFNQNTRYSKLGDLFRSIWFSLYIFVPTMAFCDFNAEPDGQNQIFYTLSGIQWNIFKWHKSKCTTAHTNLFDYPRFGQLIKKVFYIKLFYRPFLLCGCA